MAKYWLMKSEADVYSIDDLEKDGSTLWDGVRNYQARNNLRAMKKGDQVFFYHSNEGLEIVGVAKVVKEHYQDPTTDDERWSVVDLKPVKKLKRPISLQEIKEDERLQDIALVRQSRLSVMPIDPEEFDAILELSKRK